MDPAIVYIEIGNNLRGLCRLVRIFVYKMVGNAILSQPFLHVIIFIPYRPDNDSPTSVIELTDSINSSRERLHLFHRRRLPRMRLDLSYRSIKIDGEGR